MANRNGEQVANFGLWRASDKLNRYGNELV